MNQIHGSSNTIRLVHVLRTKIRVLFVFKSLRNETPLVFSILVHDHAHELQIHAHMPHGQ